MGGTWKPNPLPIRPGGYINFESSGNTPVTPGTFGRVGMPIRASWGPENDFVDIITDADRMDAFGSTDGDVTSATDTSWLIREAIIGGSALVKAYRMVGAGAIKASLILQDTTAVNCVTLEAKYSGVRANSFQILVRQSPVFSYRQDLILYEAGVELEKWTFDKDDLTRLVSRMNATDGTGSAYLVATLTPAAANEVQTLTSGAAGAAPFQAEKQTLNTGAAPLTAGQYTLTVDNGAGATVTTADIAFNANAAAIQAAINAATPAGADVVVAEVSAGGLSVASNVISIYYTGADFNGDAVVPMTIAAGTAPAVPALPGTVTIATPSQPASTFTLTFDDGTGALTTSALAYNSTADQIQTALRALANVGSGTPTSPNVTVTAAVLTDTTATASGVMTVTFSGSLSGQNLAQMIVTPSVTFGGTLTAGTSVPGTPSNALADLAAPTTMNTTVGTDGAAISLVDYTTAMTAFEAEGGFDLFVLDGVSNADFPGLDAAMKVWADTNNAAGRYVMVVTGGSALEATSADTATALSRSALFDSEWVVSIGVSGLAVTSPAGNTLNLSSAQSAPRVAGMIAASGITGSITFGEVVGAKVYQPLTPANIELLIQEGVVVFSKRGDVTRIEDGVTTFTSLTEEKDFTFSQIRAVRAIQTIGIDVSTIVERDWIGQKVNTTSVRDSLVARLSDYFGTLEAQRVLVNGTQVAIDTRYNNNRTDVYVLVLAQFQFELKRVLLTVRVPTVA